MDDFLTAGAHFFIYPKNIKLNKDILLSNVKCVILFYKCIINIYVL